jgi:hypothetical protein
MSARSDEDQQQRARQIDRVLEEAGREVGTTEEEPAHPDIPPERARNFRTASLSRMRLSWDPRDEMVMSEVRRQAELIIRREFAAAFEIMDAVWLRVRQPVLSEDGRLDPVRDQFGSIMWVKGITGRPVEDWTLLGPKDRDTLMWRTISVLFELEQRAADMWGESMFAKAAWEEQFAVSYDAPEGKRTVEDRTALGRLGSMDERYFGIFQSWLSRRADAVVRIMQLLNQRMKDAAA